MEYCQCEFYPFGAKYCPVCELKIKTPFEILREKYTDEEIAESHIFPSELTPEEEAKELKELQEFIKQNREKRMIKEAWARKITIECFRAIAEEYHGLKESESLEFALDCEGEPMFRRFQEIILKYKYEN